MIETHLQSRPSIVPGTWGSLLVLVGLILIGMAAGSIVGILLISSIWGDAGILTQIGTLEQTPDFSAENWYKIILLQAIGHLLTFLVPSLLYWRLVERKPIGAFCLQSRDSYRSLIPIFFLTITLMPFTGLVAEWNESMVLPDALSGIEAWMKNSESSLARLTDFLLSFHNTPELIIAIIVIAVIPAIGEEVLFRGILQRKLAEHWANVHVGIWTSAFLFSAIHFQFYGFLPRLFLGAMFGYLYFWTGQLSMAIFAHFINNSVTVLMMWMYRQQIISLDIASSQAIPLWLGAASLIISSWLLRVVYKTPSEPSSQH